MRSSPTPGAIFQADAGSAARSRRQVGGLTVAARALRAVESAGVEQVWLIGPEAGAIAGQLGSAGPRAEVRIGLPPGDAPCLRLPIDAVFHPRLPARMIESGATFPGAHRDLFLVKVLDDRSARRAETLLFDTLRKPSDGLVSRWINRPISLAITRRIAGTAATPNMVTAAVLLLAVAAALLVGLGVSPITDIAGAFLYQLSSIVDGVDGELARLRYAGTRHGESIDTVTDDLGTLAFTLAVAVRMTRETGGAPWAVVASALAVGGFVLMTSLTYVRAWRSTRSLHKHRFLWFADDTPAPLVRLLHPLFKHDFDVLLVATLVATGARTAALSVLALGGAIAAAAAVVRARKAGLAG